MNTLLEMKGVYKNFGGVKAIDNFNFEIQEHKIVGLIGPNGAGKTTIFNTITGLYKPSSGEIIFKGKKITNSPPDEVAQHGIGRTFQNIRLFSNLSVLQNVIIAGTIHLDYSLSEAFFRAPRYRAQEKALKEKAMSLLEYVDLQDYANHTASSLPYGHQRRLEIARALAIDPVLLLLDEPAAGMNAEESMGLVKFIRSIKEDFNLTILMIEHHMDVVSELCDYAAVLEFGKKLQKGILRI